MGCSACGLADSRHYTTASGALWLCDECADTIAGMAPNGELDE